MFCNYHYVIEFAIVCASHSSVIGSQLFAIFVIVVRWTWFPASLYVARRLIWPLTHIEFLSSCGFSLSATTLGFVIEMRENKSKFWAHESLYFSGLFKYISLKVNPLPHTEVSCCQSTVFFLYGTKWVGSNGNSYHLYLGGVHFEYGLGHHLFCLKCLWFLSGRRWYSVKCGHSHFPLSSNYDIPYKLSNRW